MQQVFRIQHRLLRKVFQQHLRLCSNQQTLRTQQQLQEDYANCYVEPQHTSLFATQPEPIIHDDQVGPQFSSKDLQVRLASPDQLESKPDDTGGLGFGKVFTDHMLKVSYHKFLGGWQKPQITPLENLVLHPAAKVLHYAVGVSVSLFKRITKQCPYLHSDLFLNGSLPTIFLNQ